MAQGERPWRLWDADAKSHVAHHYYQYKENAQIGAYLWVYDSPIGTKIEVYNVNTARVIGQYIRRVHSVYFLTGKALMETKHARTTQSRSNSEVQGDDEGEEGPPRAGRVRGSNAPTSRDDRPAPPR